jgi:N,N'-diacetylchitobiose phosphorylase
VVCGFFVALGRLGHFMKSVTADSPRVRSHRDGDTPRHGIARPAVLSNGAYSVQMSEAGGGYSELNGIALTRWSPDPTRDADGFHIYIRDLDDNWFWSAGYQPTGVSPIEYAFQSAHDSAEIVRLDREIECRLKVTVSPSHNFEIRTLRLTNFGTRSRRLEITSYLEWVLTLQEADRNHPAFSKLFIETQFCASPFAILARRRPRNRHESEFWGFHSLGGGEERFSEIKPEFETNRTSFIGRGGTLRRPNALLSTAPLSGNWGPVLDPIAGLRVSLKLDPAHSREVCLVLGGAERRTDLDRALAAAHAVSKSLVPPPKAIGLNGRGAIPQRAELAESLLHRHVIYQADLANGKTQHPAAAAHVRAAEILEYENGYGGFSDDGREYVIRIRATGALSKCRPPLPWVNVIANERAGFLVSESGSGYTWSGNSRTNRLSAWKNDPVCDPPSEAIWIRDEERNIFWSPTPGPTPARGEYEVRHAFGYTTFHHASHELAQEVTMFVPREEAVKLTRIRITNCGTKARRLSLFSYLQWALGGLTSETSASVVTEHGPEDRTIWAINPNREIFGKHVAFSTFAVGKKTSCELAYTCDRTSFLGRYGDTDLPAAVASAEVLDSRSGPGLDPCAAWQLMFELLPGDVFECTWLVGDASNREEAMAVIGKYGDSRCVEEALADVRQFWLEMLSAVQIRTPCREMDLMVNGWLTYQNLSCRMWGRSAYYQPGGAFGFRDQLQDSAALIHYEPALTREQILRHARQQFEEGDVLHWWHADSGYGLRTRFSDDFLWLPCITAEYIGRTGDSAVLDEDLPFIAAPPLAVEQQEAYLRPAMARVSASLYEHCCRAIDHGLTSGPHGLPLIGCGDWNDGFSQVGVRGKGESVWLGFFIHYILERMIPICASRDDQRRVAYYEGFCKRLAERLNTAGWDGSWYRRAYYDNGDPIGSATSSECQIDAIAQAWAVISGVAPPERAKLAMLAAEERLVCRDAGMMRLLTPAFDRSSNDPGYIKGYLPGIRENGGQYTHGVLWAVRALAELGHGTRAVRLLQLLTPVWHTSNKQRADVYQTEPYVVAADVYGEPPHVGRGGWTWYTGSAGWMLRVVLESILGIRCDAGQVLVINPSISKDWPECHIRYRVPGERTTYDITIENPEGKQHGVAAARLDDRPVAVVDGIVRILIERDGGSHRVVVRL